MLLSNIWRFIYMDWFSLPKRMPSLLQRCNRTLARTRTFGLHYKGFWSQHWWLGKSPNSGIELFEQKLHQTSHQTFTRSAISKIMKPQNNMTKHIKEETPRTHTFAQPNLTCCTSCTTLVSESGVINQVQVEHALRAWNRASTLVGIASVFLVVYFCCWCFETHIDILADCLLLYAQVYTKTKRGQKNKCTWMCQGNSTNCSQWFSNFIPMIFCRSNNQQAPKISKNNPCSTKISL